MNDNHTNNTLTANVNDDEGRVRALPEDGDGDHRQGPATLLVYSSDFISICWYILPNMF